MALSAGEQATIKALITREGGLPALNAQVQALFITTQQAAAISLLAPAITVTVQDWAVVNATVSQASSVTLYNVVAALTAAFAAQDATKLGPLFVALCGAVKANYGI